MWMMRGVLELYCFMMDKCIIQQVKYIFTAYYGSQNHYDKKHTQQHSNVKMTL